MMTREFWRLKYMQTDSFLAVELPYYNRPVSMFIFMPTQYGKAALAEFEREFQQHFRSFQHHKPTASTSVELTMPEFKMTAKHRFSGPVSTMGGQSIFEQEADFSGISDEKGVFIGEIIQNTHIAVDQHGTEAAAATFAAVFTGMPPPKNVILTIDHPFVFAIADRPTGVILFMGKVANPV